MFVKKPSGDSTPRFETADNYEMPRRSQRQGLYGLILLYVLAAIALYLFSRQPLVLALPLVPALVAAALYEIPGGLAGAVLSTFLAALATAASTGRSWSGGQLTTLIVTGSAYVLLGILAGWISRRERHRRSSLHSTLAEADDQRQLFLAVLESASIAVIIADGGGRLRMANRTAQEILGLPSPMKVGEDIASLAPDKRLADLFYQSTLSDTPVTGEVEGPDGRTLSASISPVPGVGNVGILQDITYFRDLEQRKRKMMSIVSHDLKNPLTAIQGYADIVLKVAQLDERQQQFVGRIRLASTHMIGRIKDLIDVAWVEVGLDSYRETVELPGLVEEAVNERGQEVAMKSLELEVDISDSLAQVMGDESRLQQAMGNLIDYAIEASDEGGKVAVRLEDGGENVRAIVAYSGGDIAQDDLDKLFERTLSVDEDPKPTNRSGLELALAQAIIEQHRGSVHAESEQGAGIRFVVTLPTT